MTSKSPEAFRTISEVAEWLGVPTHVLRFWESRFAQVKPVKRAGGRRYYRPSDMELLGGIRKLLHDDGMTIRGVQKLLREEGVKYVAAMSPPVDQPLEPSTASNVIDLEKVRLDEEAEAPVEETPPAEPAAPGTAAEGPAEAEAARLAQPAPAAAAPEETGQPAGAEPPLPGFDPAPPAAEAPLAAEAETPEAPEPELSPAPPADLPLEESPEMLDFRAHEAEPQEEPERSPLATEMSAELEGAGSTEPTAAQPAEAPVAATDDLPLEDSPEMLEFRAHEAEPQEEPELSPLPAELEAETLAPEAEPPATEEAPVEAAEPSETATAAPAAPETPEPPAFDLSHIPPDPDPDAPLPALGPGLAVRLRAVRLAGPAEGLDEATLIACRTRLEALSTRMREHAPRQPLR